MEVLLQIVNFLDRFFSAMLLSERLGFLCTRFLRNHEGKTLRTLGAYEQLPAADKPMSQGCAFGRTCGCLVALIAVILTGCASRSTVQQLNQELASLRGRVEELRKNQETTIRELARTVSELKDVQNAVAQREKSVEGQTSQVQVLDRRIEESENGLKSIRETVQDLTRQVEKLTVPVAPVTPVREKVAEPPVERPVQRGGSPEQLYNAALAVYHSRELGQAVLEFTDLIARFPKHPLAGNAQFWIGEAYYAQRDYRQALGEYQKVVERFPKGNKAPDSLLKIGLSYRALREPGRAHEAWERVVQEFPGSESAKRARALLGSRLSAAQPAQ